MATVEPPARSAFRKGLDILLEGTQISPEEFQARLESHVSDCYFDDAAAGQKFLERAQSADLDATTFQEVCAAMYGTR